MVRTGQLVEYIADNRFIVGVCLELKNDKPRVLTENNRETTVPARRLINPQGQIIDVNSSRQELLDALTRVSARREEIRSGIDLTELWELVVEEESGQTLDPVYLAGMLFGEPVDPDNVSGLIRAVIDDKLLFRYSPEGLTVTPADKVEQLTEQRARAEALEEERLRIGGWLAGVWSGRSRDGEDRLPVDGETAEQVMDLLADVAVFGQESRHFTKVKTYLEAAGIKRPRAAFGLLVRLGRFDPDEDLEIKRLRLPLNFPDDVARAADDVAATGYHSGLSVGRRDLDGLDIFTIDGPETRDFDDALSVETLADGLRVHIHIADPTPFLDTDSALDVEARNRASSIYLPDKRIPMLPPSLSEGLLSLLEGRRRPAISLMVNLDAEMNVTGHSFTKTDLAVTRRLTYGQADEMIAQEQNGLDRLWQLAQRLKDRRRDEGAMILEVPEVSVFHVGEGRVEVTRHEEQGPARMMVAEMMVLANRLAAGDLAEAGVPALFRAQEPPSGRFEAPEGADPLWVTLRQRMLFNRLELTTCPAPHAGMGLEAYTTFTSPIRRYLDLVAIRQMGMLMDGGLPVYNEPELEELCQTVAPLLRTHNQLRFRRNRYWLLKYMSQDMDREWEAVVLDRLARNFSLMLLDTMLRMPSPKCDADTLTPGTRIKVRATKIDPLDDIIRLEFV